MNKTKKAGIVLAVLMVAAALAAPAIADYSGDHSLTTYEHGMVNDGGMVYEAVTDGSGYTALSAIGSATYSQDITISIPEGATVKLARLYNYYTWSKPDYGNYSFPGLPAEAEFTFNEASVICQNPSQDISEIPNPIYYGDDAVQHWDSKGQGYASKKYDCPSGTFAWDVTDLVTGSDTYTATITNADSSPTEGESYNTFGFGLLVVYENADPKKPNTQYWITEGCDYLMARTYETPEDATTSARFKGGVPRFKDVEDATLTTVLSASDTRENMVYFNGEEIGPSTAVDNNAIGVNEFDVTEGLIHTNNIAEFQDRNDCEVVCNAFLVVEYEE